VRRAIVAPYRRVLIESTPIAKTKAASSCDIRARVGARGQAPTELSCSQVGEELREHRHILNLANCAAHAELVLLEKVAQSIPVNQVYRWRTVAGCFLASVR
jgi:hypothetical protein